MEITTINAEALAKAFLAGAKNLEAKKEWINELNVFPVPDGDTGTNMSMTIMSAAKEVAAMAEPDMKSLAKAISSGSLRGARGNSGVILSQLFRGFTKVIAEYDEIDVQVLSDAFEKAVETAYKAVMKPKEGTILTVAKGMSDKAAELGEETDDLAYFCEEIIKEGDHVLSKTPDMLPVLKQAGVVDSGGQGLMQVLKGAFDALMGKEVDYKVETVSTGSSSQGTASNPYIDAQAEQEITFTYCTQFLIMLEHPFTENQETEFKSYLESIGDSIVVVADDEIVKVHVHTNDPGLAIQKGLSYGELTRMKIDNMREEHQEKLIKDAEKLAKQQAEEEKKPAKKTTKKEKAAEAGNVEGGDQEALSTAMQPALNFTDEDTLVWPISGNILVNFSMDQTIYFPTLDQYKYNPAIVIEAHEGDLITAAAAGKVTGVYEDREIGKAVTMDLGNGYEVTYGQLDNILVSEGSYVAKGDVIAQVASPTKYYSVEGTNVYFKLTKDGVPVNPMSKLK